MPIFFLKSLLAIGIVLSTLFALYTMFEVFGRVEKKYDTERFKKVHRANGVFFILLYLVIAYFCLDYLLKTRAEPSPRAAFHGVFALAVIVLLILKVFIVRVYRGFYNQAKTLGLLVALISLGMVGTSAGYYLLVTRLGTELPGKKPPEKAVPPPEEVAYEVKTDPETIAEGKELYMTKCFFCHDPYSLDTITGPGHQGLLKRERLPVSGKPATPENVANQLRNPYDKMPSFAYLSKEEIERLLAFLNTL